MGRLKPRERKNLLQATQQVGSRAQLQNPGTCSQMVSFTSQHLLTKSWPVCTRKQCKGQGVDEPPPHPRILSGAVLSPQLQPQPSRSPHAYLQAVLRFQASPWCPRELVSMWGREKPKALRALGWPFLHRTRPEFACKQPFVPPGRGRTGRRKRRSCSPAAYLALGLTKWGH